jgi:DNA-directed RNA polymerase specialized sigma24 family protein
VLSHLRGSKVDELMLQEAMSIIQEWAERTAAALLRRWHISNYAIEAKDIVQKWYVTLCSKWLKQCKAGRPVAAFAYIILRRCCTALVRRESRSPLRQLESDVCHAKATWLDAIAQTETLSVLEGAITRLSARQRGAVELWLLHKASKRRLRFESRKARRRFHNLMFLARRRLKQILRDHFAEADDSQFLSRAA